MKIGSNVPKKESYEADERPVDYDRFFAGQILAQQREKSSLGTNSYRSDQPTQLQGYGGAFTAPLPTDPSYFAGFMARSIAYIIDNITFCLLAFLCFSFSGLFFGEDNLLGYVFPNFRAFLAAFSDGTFVPPDQMPLDEFFAILGVQFLGLMGLVIVLWLVYCTACEASPLRGTLGKKLLGLSVVNAQNEGLSILRSLTRNILKFFFGVIVLFEIIALLLSERKQSLHCMLSGSYVLR